MSIKFTVAIKYNCDQTCEYTIECDEYRDILLDFRNTPIRPNGTNSSGGGVYSWRDQLILCQKKVQILGKLYNNQVLQFNENMVCKKVRCRFIS